MDLPTNYILESVYRNSKRIKHKNHKVYNFECPICNEGKSKGKKRRGYYFLNNNYFYCQNCQKSWSPVNWIMQVEHLTFKEVLEEAKEHDNTFSEILYKQKRDKPKGNTQSLPYDSINLSDPVQLKYYKKDPVVRRCLEYIKSRRLNNAINRPKNFYVSLSDFIHKNRLCIPFYNSDGKIIYYQTRALFEKDEEIAKYLSKTDCEKSLFGVGNIDPELEHIFIFEGPIDSMFCKNGVAVCGLNMTDVQAGQLNKYRLFDKIWVLDNQLDNPEVKEKYIQLIERGEKIFFWPKEFANYKDINEICMATGKNHIPYKLFLNNCYSGMQARIALKERLI
jgi:hypothetical protein